MKARHRPATHYDFPQPPSTMAEAALMFRSASF